MSRESQFQKFPARTIGRELRKWREAAGISQSGVRNVSESTIYNLERGKNARVDPGRVMHLCWVYKVPQDITEGLVELAEASQDERWWQRFSQGGQSYMWMFVQYENLAGEVRSHDSNWIPGLLQCEEYLDAVYDRIQPWERAAPDLSVAKELRLERQRRMIKHLPRQRQVYIIGQAAMEVQFPDPDVLVKQREHLLSLAKLEGIDILITPFSAGTHRSMGCEYNILDGFPDDEDKPFVYQPVLRGQRYFTQQADVEFFRYMFQQTLDMSIPVKEYFQ